MYVLTLDLPSLQCIRQQNEIGSFVHCCIGCVRLASTFVNQVLIGIIDRYSIITRKQHQLWISCIFIGN